MASSPDSSEETTGVTIADDGIVRWVLRSDEGIPVAVRDFLAIVTIVAVVGTLLVGISGAWPPLVAIESGSMEPNIATGDLVFVVDEGRFVGDDPVEGTGIVTLAAGRENGYEKFGDPGDVIIFHPNGDERRTPVIHRAHFQVENGENWVRTKADPGYLNGRTCDELSSCPASHDGFVTKGDANPGYDQVSGIGANTTVVDSEWVVGKAMVRVPWLGRIRLTADSILAMYALSSSGAVGQAVGVGFLSVGGAAVIAMLSDP